MSGALSPSAAQSAARKDGRIRVAIVDSGVDTTHPWLAECVIESLEVTSTRPGAFAVGPSSSGDQSGHGTACAGIVHRVAPRAVIVSVRALGPDGRGSRDALLAGLRYCVREEIAVVNLSLGIDMPKAQPLRPTDVKSIVDLYEIADEAYAHGVVIIAAGPNAASFRTYPGKAKSLIGVGRGTFADPERLELDITHEHDIMAAGTDVLAPALGGGERRWTGTSFACPHVAGHVARVVERLGTRDVPSVRAALYELARGAPSVRGTL